MVNIHEYQAKEILKKFGILVPAGACARTPAEAVDIAKRLGADVWILKAQVHSGGRGKAGGVRVAHSLKDVDTLARQMIGMRLVTPQTGPKGQIARLLYVVEGVSIAKEFYLSLVVDRRCARLVVVLSAQGGVEIEFLATHSPEKILTIPIDPLTGFKRFHGRTLASFLGLREDMIPSFIQLTDRLYHAFTTLDCELIELNPLVLTSDGRLMAVDAKMAFDDNALFRHPDLLEMDRNACDDPLEQRARDVGLNYITLDGTIGCMVNGAGLAMATLDLVHLRGGRPANFLDVGGGASPTQLNDALRLILADSKVRAVLVNIFGGIVHCDGVARSLVKVLQEERPHVPIIVRLAGNHAEQARQILEQAGLGIRVARDLEDGVYQVIKAVRETVSKGMD